MHYISVSSSTTLVYNGPVLVGLRLLFTIMPLEIEDHYSPRHDSGSDPGLFVVELSTTLNLY